MLQFVLVNSLFQFALNLVCLGFLNREQSVEFIPPTALGDPLEDCKDGITTTVIPRWS